MSAPARSSQAAWRERLRIIIFEADTLPGKIFDISLLVAIALSVLVVMLESVDDIESAYGPALRTSEWIFTILFSVEYVLRLMSVPQPSHYARSFFGIVDLLSILPAYLSLLVPGSQSLLVIRALRLLRIFRVFKLARFLGEANVLGTAIRSSRYKVFVFLGTVLVLVVILGSTMFVVEGPEHGFSSIPRAMYWAVVTMTTVGYGDLSPQTVLGQLIASAVMIIGYGIIAIPTGIVTAEIVTASRALITTRSCPSCLSEGHERDAAYCKDCGEALEVRQT
jgi:voltage-gated potassium channel